MDDDIDIMPPPVYIISLISYITFKTQNNEYILLKNDDSYTYTMAKVFDQETVMIDNTLWRNFDKARCIYRYFPN